MRHFNILLYFALIGGLIGTLLCAQTKTSFAQGIVGLSGGTRAVAAPPAGSAGNTVTGRGQRGSTANSVVASVDGRMVYLNDLASVANTLPDSMRALPFESLMPVLVDRMVDHAALLISAQRSGFDKRPELQAEMQAAADRYLESAWLGEVTRSKVTDAQILTRFNQVFASRPTTEEIRARHILVGTEEEAKAILAELKKGAEFATIARVVSKDPDGQRGGDLGFFRRDQVWPNFADAAFQLQPGQVSPVPIHNEFGWHVIKIEERRFVAPPTLPEAREHIRRELTIQAVQDAIADAKNKIVIRKYNLDGSDAESNPALLPASRR